jgi:hypothetical protein
VMWHMDGLWPNICIDAHYTKRFPPTLNHRWCHKYSIFWQVFQAIIDRCPIREFSELTILTIETRDCSLSCFTRKFYIDIYRAAVKQRKDLRLIKARRKKKEEREELWKTVLGRSTILKGVIKKVILTPFERKAVIKWAFVQRSGVWPRRCLFRTTKSFVVHFIVGIVK